MKDNNSKELMFEKFTWMITNFSKFDCMKVYSQKFLLDHHTWRILVYPKGVTEGYLSIFLDAAAVNLPFGWSKFAKFKLSLINQVNGKRTIIRETTRQFNAKETAWGLSKFISLDELCDSISGFLVKDNCMIQVEILVSKSEKENRTDEPVSKNFDTHDQPTQHKETFRTSFGELVDFRDLGKVEQAFVPLLEEVCSRHPLLINSQQQRSGRFVEWAFTALGRVLHFLKTKKVKDMDDDACNHLKMLWEELQMFKFDLTWLEPHVQYALSMKTCAERAIQVKRMRENVDALEMKTKRLKTEMIEAKMNLGTARKELVKAKKGFEERELDAKLGYGIP